MLLTGCGQTANQKSQVALEKDGQGIEGGNASAPTRSERLEAEAEGAKATTEQHLLEEAREPPGEDERSEEREEEKTAKLEAEGRRYTAKVNRLLRGRGAVGMTTAEVRHRLGAPSHTQEISGQEYVYYLEGEDQTEYQLIVEDGRVVTINRY